MNVNSKRLKESEKYANDKQWFKDCMDNLESFNALIPGGETWKDRYEDIKINLDLYDGKINKEDFINVIAPFGENVGELPANFNNKNIVFNKINAVTGIELTRPFDYRLVAVNKEATTRKEQAKYGMFKDWIVQSIMQELKEKIVQEHAEEFQQLEQMKAQIKNQPEGEEGQPQMSENQVEIQQLQQMAEELEQRIQQEIIDRTPDEIHRYMSREYQDPAEIMFNQLLELEMKRLNVKDEINTGCGYAANTAIEAYRVFEKKGKPALMVLNPLGFTFNKSIYSERIEDGDWATYTTFEQPNEVLNEYYKDLTIDELDKIDEAYSDIQLSPTSFGNKMTTTYDYSMEGIKVQHFEWKALKQVKFLTYQDDDGVHQTIVDHSYEMDEEIGDIAIEDEWILTRYEGTKIGGDIYVRMREVPGQHRDINNVHECKLSYVGIVYENGISLTQRLRNYQYLYDILLYRMELATGKDRGRIAAINQDIIPREVDIPTWLINAEKSGFTFFSTMDEGGKHYPFDVTSAVKELDLSHSGDIQKYQLMADFVDLKAGESIGVTKAMQGQVQEREAVANVQQSIAQGTTILQKFYNTHDKVKRNVIDSLIKLAQDIYSRNKTDQLVYSLDDLSIAILTLDQDYLENTSLGIFTQDTALDFAKLNEIKVVANNALHSGKLEMEDYVSLYSVKTITEAEENLKLGKQRREKREDEVQQMQHQHIMEQTEKTKQDAIELQTLAHEQKMEQIRLQGEIDLTKAQMELNRQIIYTSGFDQEKDRNENKIPDYVEMARKAQKDNEELRLKLRKQQLDEDKFKHQKEIDKEKLEIDKKKATKNKA